MISSPRKDLTLTCEISDAWAALERELELWRQDNVPITLWWRDDDAQKPSAQLDRLIQLSITSKTPLVLATIPRGVDVSLPGKIGTLPDISSQTHWQLNDSLHPSYRRTPVSRAAGGEPGALDTGVRRYDGKMDKTSRTLVTIVQHGWSHSNHAPPREKKCELGDHRPLNDIEHELTTGAKILAELFGDMFLPVLVPPWNRISTTVTDQLENYGYVGLSTFGDRKIVQVSSGLHQANTHVDLINWHGDRAFIGTKVALE